MFICIFFVFSFFNIFGKLIHFYEPNNVKWLKMPTPQQTGKTKKKQNSCKKLNWKQWSVSWQKSKKSPIHQVVIGQNEKKHFICRVLVWTQWSTLPQKHLFLLFSDKIKEDPSEKRRQKRYNGNFGTMVFHKKMQQTTDCELNLRRQTHCWDWHWDWHWNWHWNWH